MDKWRKLPTSERQLHNLENCVQCETMSSKQQTLFDAACLKSKRKGKALRDITNTSTQKQSKKSTGTTSSDLQIPPEAVKRIEMTYKRNCEKIMQRNGNDLQSLLANGSLV